MPAEALVQLSSELDIVVARQKGREMALGLGFSGVDLTLIATAISEVARNIVKYAQRGEILLETVDKDGLRGLRVTASDQGPGIPDISQAMQDGFSTGHGLGLGLPGAKRLMDALEVRSAPGKGTTVVMEKWRRSGPARL
jgi:serine/threonine-protein kinase RsbT